jgi:DNA-binding NtrC family response regulator
MPPLHVLVLSRGAERRDALVSALRVAGHQVVSVPDAPAAAEAIGSAGFDALVLDLGWPELEPARLSEVLAPAASVDPDTLDAAERRHIALTLRYTGGNRRRAAQLLGISRSTLLNKVRKYDLDEGGQAVRRSGGRAVR